MTYPDFFNKIETIKLQDDLASFLGVFDEGIIEFSYVDLVKTAGHSCPTVLGAYLMTSEALKVLYKDVLPKRGQIEVSFNEKQTQGVTGVIANVISNITGACSDYGFKGIMGNFNRNELLKFEENLGEVTIRFKRLDTQKVVNVLYNASIVPSDPNTPILMQKIIQGLASKEEKKEFGELWQKRVELISLNKDCIKVIF